MPKRTDTHKVLIIGSGPIVIGQACEFDYAGTQTCIAMRKLDYEIVLVNSKLYIGMVHKKITASDKVRIHPNFNPYFLSETSPPHLQMPLTHSV